MFFKKLQHILWESKPAFTKPVKYNFVISDAVANAIEEKGYYVADFVTGKQLDDLLNLYKHFHQVEHNNNGETFFSVFSNNPVYRKQVHNDIEKVLTGALAQWFTNYRTIVNNFVIKPPGNAGKVDVHQDLPIVDELKFSSLNIWVPLPPFSAGSGMLNVVPRSHLLFYPYRTALDEPMHKNITEEIAQHFTEIEVKEGQAVIFDSRMLHFTPPNLTNTDRIVVLLRVSSYNAKSTFCSRVDNENVAVWECDDDFWLTHSVLNVQALPTTGKVIKTVKATGKAISAADFNSFAKHSNS
jgi:ectoine hydroxylase-related dioxygenase (phytanoyl-CoA dioxygenase family)